ncbi:hypothetical protein FPQ18DRAFT_389627 [Pyronema domesticum]|nr:hypothetical protein FPQ18DRAFT_389627 [Pyronema domesticum]
MAWESYDEFESLEKGSRSTESLYIAISPHFSYGKLQISREALLKVLSNYSVFPNFLDVLQTFGAKTERSSDEFGVYYQHSSERCFQVCYNLKYIGYRPNYNNPSSPPLHAARKTGLWAMYDYKSKRSVWILLQPSEDFKERLCKNERLLSFMDVHRLQLACAEENIKDYIEYLERNFIKLRDEACTAWKQTMTPSIDDARKLHIQRDQLLHLEYILTLNEYVIRRMKEGFGRLQGANNAVHTQKSELKAFQTSLSNSLGKIEYYRKRVEGLNNRCGSLAALVPIILASQENGVMRAMQVKAAEYSRSMKIVTFLTLVYLPPMLVAVSATIIPHMG